MWGVSMAVEVKTKRGHLSVVLRPITQDHVPYLVRGLSSWDVIRYTSLRNPVTEKGEREWIEKTGSDETEWAWGIFPDDQSIPVGVTSLRQINHFNHNAVSGYICWDKNYWGIGLAGTACHPARTLAAVELLNLDTINSSAMGPNIGSILALHGVGYTMWGKEDFAHFEHGVYIPKHNFVWLHPDRTHVLFGQNQPIPEKYRVGLEKAARTLEMARHCVAFL